VSEHAPPDGGPSGPTTQGDALPAPAERQGDASPAIEPAARRGARRDVVFFLIAAAVIALDQVTKVVIRATLSPHEAWPDRDWVLNIVNVSNSGAAFGILQGQTVFLVVTSLVGVAAIVLYYFYPPLEHGVLRVALGLQLGGAAGNLIDRVRFGEVTDFVNFDFWPAFNVADASISIGVATIMWFFLVQETEILRRPRDAGTTGD
jgi:signal peptidase II